MKILTLSAILAAAVLSFASCNKQYDTEVSDSQTNNNGGGSGSNFNWNGTPPLSAKVDGVPFQAVSIDGFMEFAGYYGFIAEAADGSSINPAIPVGAVPGLVYSMPSPANLGWQNSSTGAPIGLQASPGKVKIITNNATTLEGYFWADMKDPSGQRDTVVHITEGYFKVDKP